MMGGEGSGREGADGGRDTEGQQRQAEETEGMSVTHDL